MTPRLLPLWALLLGGCSNLQPILDQTQREGIATADALLAAGRIAYCDAPTLGALRRHYGSDLAALRQHLLACGWTAQALASLIGTP